MKNDQELIVILGGALKKTGVDQWRTTTFFEGDRFGISGDRLRVVAASYLYKKDKKQLFLVSGGKGQYKKIVGVPPLAQVLRDELIQLNIPDRRIIIEKKSGNTLGQLLAVQNIIKKKKEFKDIVIISNHYHLPRIKAFINYYSGLIEIKRWLKIGRLKLLAAEKVLLKIDSKKWQKIINEAYISKAMKERLIMEKQGIKQIKNGTYHFRDSGNKKIYEK